MKQVMEKYFEDENIIEKTENKKKNLCRMLLKKK
jgi:hypothetical protein